MSKRMIALLFGIVISLNTQAADFMWGISSSPYQTEDVYEAKNSPLFFKTDWDLFFELGKLHTPKGDGVFSFSEIDRDIKTLVELGVTHYRFGIEWARVEPQPGVYNEKALDHYLSFVKKLKSRNIVPIICLWHFTFPSWAFKDNDSKKFGWFSPAVKERWPIYVKKVVEKFKDEVEMYAPQNEPNIESLAGFFLGSFPPGEKYNLKLYRAHMQEAAERFIEAADIIHKSSANAKVISIQNLIAWEKAWWDVFSYFYNIGDEFNFLHLDLIKDHVDMIGFNYYYKLKASPFSNPRIVYPNGIAEMAEKLNSRYNKPLLITENGWWENPEISKEEYFLKHWQVIDEIRLKYNLKGYFYWSLFDNYEWAEGYNDKFGMFKYERPLKKITPYSVAAAFKKVIKDDLKLSK